MIDLEENAFKTLPVAEVLSPRYPPLRYLAQVDEDGYLAAAAQHLLEGEHQPAGDHL